MDTNSVGKVGLLWRGDRNAPEKALAENSRLHPVFAALAERHVSAEPVLFSDDAVDDVRRQLLQLDGVLVWVDPISNGYDRSRLDPLLREVSDAGVWVSAHPKVILKMGTKEVLYNTRDVGWGSDVYLYRTMGEFRRDFPPRLAAGASRVLKQQRGNGGIGVWKVSPLTNEGEDGRVRVQHARPRDTATEDLPLAAFIERCRQYFAGSGCLIDQPFQSRIVDGMIRCYMVQREVAGFAHQWPEGLGPGATGPAQENVLGLPAQKTMYRATEPRFATLRELMQSRWVPAMQRAVAVDDDSLPLLWDADFLYGARTAAGEDSYVLCEINVSSVSPFPEPAVPRLAGAVATRLTSRP